MSNDNMVWLAVRRKLARSLDPLELDTETIKWNVLRSLSSSQGRFLVDTNKRPLRLSVKTKLTKRRWPFNRSIKIEGLLKGKIFSSSGDNCRDCVLKWVWAYTPRNGEIRSSMELGDDLI